MANKKKSKAPDKSEIPIYDGNGFNQENILSVVRNGYSNDDDALNKLLQRRMKRNEEMGLQVSPEDTTIQYGEDDPVFYNKNVRGYVHPDRPNDINISPMLRNTPTNQVDENSLKYTLAHELQHVNQFNTKDKQSSHEDPYFAKYTKLHPLVWGGLSPTSEKSRKLRSLMYPAQERKDMHGQYDNYKSSYDTVFNVQDIIKYAKEQGVPFDDIIDAMTINSALPTDQIVFDAHQQTKENQKVGRGILGTLGLEKPLSTEEVYKPWKEMKEKRKSSK